MRIKKKKSRLSISKIILKSVIFACLFSLIVSVYLIIGKDLELNLFVLKQVVFIGNKHLTDQELIEMANIKKGVNLMPISIKEICKNLMKSPWVKKVSVRKELPDRLTIVIKEAEPFALLDMKGRFFIIDEQGKLLEEIQGNSVPFLPVISSDPFKNREVFLESLELVKALQKEGLMNSRESMVVLADKLSELSVVIDGIYVKIGPYDYQEKLQKFAKLEDFIKSEGMNVEYIDLRFKKRAYVKPLNSGISSEG